MYRDEDWQIGERAYDRNHINKVLSEIKTNFDDMFDSFVDSGFQSIEIGEINYLPTPRLICSKVNEERNIQNSPGSKSLTMEFLMETENSLVSPVIDTIKTSTILTSNLINNPNGIGENSNYATTDNQNS